MIQYVIKGSQLTWESYMSCAKKRFTEEDQFAFASLSGDLNPIHIDRIAARRTKFGLPIVHGMHFVLWALNQSLASQSVLQSISVQFRNALSVGEAVTIVDVFRTDCRLSFSIWSAEAIIASVSVTFFLGPSESSSNVIGVRPVEGVASNVGIDDLPSIEGSVDVQMDIADCDKLFPGFRYKIRVEQIAALLGTTRIVGMKCPGLYSIFSELVCVFAPISESKIRYRVRSVDRRFSRVLIDLNGALSGHIAAFVRPPPVVGPSSAQIVGAGIPKDMTDRKAIVVGGSRGIGEALVKLLALRGAEVRFTYLHGLAEANDIVRDVSASGGAVSAFQMDAESPKLGLLNIIGDGWHPTHLYYMATPPIFVTKGRRFNADIFAAFCRHYVSGFADIVGMIPARPLTVFYPSTVAIDEPQINLAEYAAAKAAGEMICRNLQLSDRSLSICVERLIRTETDQTRSVVPVAQEDALTAAARILDRC